MSNHAAPRGNDMEAMHYYGTWTPPAVITWLVDEIIFAGRGMDGWMKLVAGCSAGLPKSPAHIVGGERYTDCVFSLLTFDDS